METARQLFANRRFLNCVGGIDATHIPILAHLINKSDFYNRKGFYSINVMAFYDGKRGIYNYILKYYCNIFLYNIFIF